MTYEELSIKDLIRLYGELKFQSGMSSHGERKYRGDLIDLEREIFDRLEEK